MLAQKNLNQQKVNKKYKTLFAMFFAFVVFLLACQKQVVQYQMQGNTMGTTWSVIVQYPRNQEGKSIFPLSQEDTQMDIERELKRINSVMSTYQKDSEITKFNDFAGTSFYEVSDELQALTYRSLQVSRASGGKYDVTVGALVDLWGFGPGKNRARASAPTKEEVQETLKHVGFQKLEMKKVGGRWYFAKQDPRLRIDLSSLAKGYAVDKIFQLMDAAGFSAIMVEIGGEVRARGKNLIKNTPWKIGVEKPLRQKRELYQILRLDGMAVATSGNYRNYFEDTQTTHVYSHTIDPQSGYPQEDPLAGVSVIDKDCSTADAWATAFMSMGLEKALSYAHEKNMPVVFLWIDKEGKIQKDLSGNYNDYVTQQFTD